ncbi:MAG TPA: hypothetical protein DCS93_16300 [Microscillaceae bacterium]|nr:hypothetical protein [Microscillaceae bacterium]
MATNKIIVLIPGTTGSTLVKKDQSYHPLITQWPAKVIAYAKLGLKAAALKVLEDPSLVAGQPIMYGLSAPTAYHDFIHYFEHLYDFESKNFRELDDLKGTLPNRLLVAFAYDWRVNNEQSALELQKTLNEIDSIYKNDYEVYLVAHSMGGIVGRYYLETGIAKKDAVYNHISAFITLGTPHLGAPLALNAILGNMQKFSSIDLGTDIQQFVDDSRYPSTYQLLPLADDHFVEQGNEKYSVFSESQPNVNQVLIKDYSANAQNFDAASEMFAKLSYKYSSTIPYYLMVGKDNQQGTQLTYTYTTKGTISPDPGKLNMGDGIVPMSSAAFEGSGVPSRQVFYFEGGKPNVPFHLDLPGDQNIQKKIAGLMSL